MDRFCVICNKDKKNAYETAVSICNYLKNKGKDCTIVKNQLTERNGRTFYTDEDSISDDIDGIIVLGGDGTMIRAANDLFNINIPLFGINLGNVGFLTESGLDSMYDDIDKLISGNYRIEKRIMLQGHVRANNVDSECCALNDFVVSKRDYGKLIAFEVYVNDQLLDSFLADGIIISSPTGSTGYNLSAGGPVMAPEMNAIAVTPVCPHSLNDRSFVIDGDSRISIRLIEGKNSDMDTAIVTSDGRTLTGIVSGDILYVQKAENDTEIIHMEKTNFYHKMRSKLN